MTITIKWGALTHFSQLNKTLYGEALPPHFIEGYGNIDQKPLHTEAFTHRSFYTQELLHTEAFIHRRFYTQKRLHTESFYTQNLHTQDLLHTESSHTGPFTHRTFYTQKPLHTEALHTEVFTHRKLLHTEAFTHRPMYTQELLHTETFTHRRSQQLLHTESFYTQKLLHREAFTHKCHSHIQPSQPSLPCQQPLLSSSPATARGAGGMPKAVKLFSTTFKNLGYPILREVRVRVAPRLWSFHLNRSMLYSVHWCVEHQKHFLSTTHSMRGIPRWEVTRRKRNFRQKPQPEQLPGFKTGALACEEVVRTLMQTLVSPEDFFIQTSAVNPRK